ncbi:MAG: type II toxin-antitoxin system HigB family toxin [Maricaulaceae bacterium]|nr:type II toxin-antitoxin system HigB family toxin [Maricaulaceae bacterium]
MRLIARRTLLTYAARHPAAKPALMRWAKIIEKGEWTSMDDLRGSFSGMKTVSADRGRFEIAGGAFRLIAAFDFRRQAAFVKFIGTHAEYDRIDAKTVAQF